MNHITRIALSLALALAIAAVGALPAHALKEGQSAPVFSLQDLSGKKHDLAAMKASPMLVL